jgi:hypothetical protein
MLEAGVNCLLSSNVKLSLDYDHKMNETSANLGSRAAVAAAGKPYVSIADYSGQIQNDKFTFQLQYMF